MNMDHWWNFIEGIRDKRFEVNPVPLPIYPPKIPHGMTRSKYELLRRGSNGWRREPWHGLRLFFISDATVLGTLHTVKARFRNIMFKKTKRMYNVQNHIRISLMIVIKVGETIWFCGIPEQRQETAVSACKDVAVTVRKLLWFAHTRNNVR